MGCWNFSPCGCQFGTQLPSADCFCQNKSPASKPGCERKFSQDFLRSEFHDLVGLRAFLTLHDIELDVVALLKALVAFRGDGAVVYENVGLSVLASDESIAFGVIEPLTLPFMRANLLSFAFGGPVPLAR